MTRTIERTTQFKRDYKRELKGPFKALLQSLDGELPAVLNALANDRALPDRCRDHVLGGEWKDFRDCHIRPDLVLIYRKPDPWTLQLARLGSHSELGL
ncbi:addiction module antitoxin [Cupriavidus necator]|uniref:Addiction module antitoxin n=1 Tax=Cupriavidus necator TaxID=106590 RepID=A0A1U9V258_CUPNE|nr:type II toxin-antitoxin system YafQ family toxin [Cupriavidus necator]AQV99022.1 addiction module antitoxin [Cupriavidus necator]